MDENKTFCVLRHAAFAIMCNIAVDMLNLYLVNISTVIV